MSSSLDEQYMRLALELAKSARGQTSPNPMVGAVLVKQNQIIGMGAHLKAGEPHAEVHALRMAGEKAEGSTLYVTLEPCSHYGKTPPCAEAVIAARIKKVYIATLDPNPLVAGRGIKLLEEAGIEVEFGLLKNEADQLNEAFFHYQLTKQPFVTLKTATTLDGKIATVSGESKWITGEEARLDVHRIRHAHDAILVGINTVLADDPSLTTRLENGEGSHPIRVILDSSLRVPLEAKVVKTAKDYPTWIFTNMRLDHEKAVTLIKQGVRLFHINEKQRLDLQEVLKLLGENEIMSLMIEGGGTVNASFLEQGLVQKVITYLAPKLIGGHLAPSAFRGEGIERLDQAIQLERLELVQLGQDVKISGYVERKKG